MPQYHTHKEWFYFEHTPGACICQQFVFFTKRPNNLNPTLDRTQTHETQATDGLDSYVLMRIRCLTIISVSERSPSNIQQVFLDTALISKTRHLQAGLLHYYLSCWWPKDTTPRVSPRQKDTGGGLFRARCPWGKLTPRPLYTDSLVAGARLSRYFSPPVGSEWISRDLVL